MHLFQVICIAIATSARQGDYLVFGCSILLMSMSLVLAGYLLCYMSSGLSCLEQQFLNRASRSQSLVERWRQEKKKRKLLPWLQAQKSSWLSSFAQLLGSGDGGECTCLSVGELLG